MTSGVYTNNDITEMRKLDDTAVPPRPTVTVVGSGDFGVALAKRLAMSGYDVVIGSRSPSMRQNNRPSLLKYRVLSIEDALNHSDIIFLAIPRTGYDQMVTSFGTRLSNKIVVDVSNRTQASRDGSSYAEYLAKLVPEARVVKGFNVISAWALENDIYGGSRLVYICGDDTEAKEKVMGIATAMQFIPVDQGSLKMAQAIENKPQELFPSWRVALGMVGVLYLIMFLYFAIKLRVRGRTYTNFPLRQFSLINAFCVIGILDMVYLPGCIAALLQLVYGTKYRSFPRWLDLWMKARKQLGLIALLLAALHACMSTLYWAPEYGSFMYQKNKDHIGNVTIVEYKKMSARGEAFLTLGVLGLTALCILGVASLPTVLNRMSRREWNFVQSGFGYFALVFALLHFTIFSYKGVLHWGVRVYFFPTLLVVVIGYITVVFRIILLTPCLANKVKKIRSGREIRGSSVI